MVNLLLTKAFIASGILFFILSLAHSQTLTYPIHITTLLNPPFSVNLADYAAPGCEQLRVIVMQRDLTQAPYKIRLSLSIELNGREIIKTNPLYNPPPLIMDPGIPTVVSGSDLYPYLDAQNLDFPGYSRETYLRTRCLPEGSYRITFTAYDYTRPDNVALSSGGSFYSYLAKSEPPLLNLPFNNAGVQALPSQFITFMWLPRTVASFNASGTTRYKFELFEIREPERNPNEIVQSSTPIYSIETDNTSLAYTIAEPALENGLRYAWRVKAFDTEGRDYIRNNGYSEVFSFIYGGENITPMPGFKVEHFEAAPAGPLRAKLTWDASSDFDSYKIHYRKQNSSSDWATEETVKNAFDLFGLDPNAVYECRVQGKKGDIWGGYSDDDTVYSAPRNIIACGADYTGKTITNRQPLLELRQNQEIEAGGFPITIISAKGSNGRFSGDGYAEVPMLANVRLYCTFNNIFVNSDYQLVEGEIPLKTDYTDNALYSVDNLTEGGANNGKVVDGTTPTIKVPVVIPSASAIKTDTTHRQILIATAPGDTTRVDIPTTGIAGETLPAVVTLEDKDGNLYCVNTKTGAAVSLGRKMPGGTVPVFTQSGAIASHLGKVTFEQVKDESVYAFDVRNKLYAKSVLFYEEYETLDAPGESPYDVPIKLIPEGRTDVVKASLTPLPPLHQRGGADSLRFITGTGTIINAVKGSDNTFTLTLPAAKVNDGYELFALMPAPGQPGKYDILGKLMVVTYTVKSPKVVVVPVSSKANRGTKPDAGSIKAELDNIYKPIGVEWQVAVDDTFETIIDSINVTGSGVFSMYTPSMRRLNAEYRTRRGGSFDASAVYLFYVPKSSSEAVAGDMPRSKQFGYIFSSSPNGGGGEGTLIAHELGHGIFHLQHTFDFEYQIPEKSTENLMDYSGGSDLVKHQWDAIHSPGLVLGMFEGDEDGEMKIFKSNLSLVFYNDSGLVHNKTIYFLPEINQEVKLKAKQTKNNILEDVKVNWSYKNQKNIPEISFKTNSEFFGDNALVRIDVTEKVLLGADSTLTYFVGKINVSPNYVIDSVLMNIMNIREEFDRLEQEVLNLQAFNMDLISLKSTDKYISQGLSEFYESPPGELQTDFDKALARMYSLDLLIKKLDNFDDLVKEIATIYSQESSKQEFFNTVIESLETINPMGTKENLEKLYKGQIINTTLEKLAGKLK